MAWSEHAQPALLYLVPSCIGIPALAALVSPLRQVEFTAHCCPLNDGRDPSACRRSRTRLARLAAHSQIRHAQVRGEFSLLYKYSEEEPEEDTKAVEEKKAE